VSASSALCFGDRAPTNLKDQFGLNDVVVVDADSCSFVQLLRPFDVAWIDCSVVDVSTESTCRAVLHAAVQHLCRGGLLVVSLDPHRIGQRERVMALAVQLELTMIDSPKHSECGAELYYRRTDRFTIHDLTRSARSSINRIEPAELARALATTDAPTVLDTRTPTDRERFGVIPGSIHIPRTIVEWSLDPANGYRNAAITSLSQSIVVVCNGGYSSSLAAANLVSLGFTRVADLVGGHHGWVRAGLPTEPPDHWSLDF
jgi:rhodanese-related sulfurtransferase